MLPSVPPDELARRLQIEYPGGPLDAQIEATLTASVELLSAQVDDELSNLFPATWREAALSTGVKVWDASAKGLAGMDATGEFAFPAPSASAGILEATRGLWGRLALTGGNVVA